MCSDRRLQKAAIIVDAGLNLCSVSSGLTSKKEAIVAHDAHVYHAMRMGTVQAEQNKENSAMVVVEKSRYINPIEKTI